MHRIARIVFFASLSFAAHHAPAADWRNIKNGLRIPDEGYCDQPYVVITKDRNWLCTLTTGHGHEGQGGQHIVSTISADKGQTWSPLVDIEPADGPEASWVMPLLTPSGRVYVFYTYNADNLRQVLQANGQPIKRVDTLGKYAYKYSDDHGRSWSKERHYLPLRTTDIDRANVYQGKIHFFWGVGKPIIDRNEAILGASKVGNFGKGFMESSEGIFFASRNILNERDPAKHEWQMLPEGAAGLRSPEGPICDEHNLVALGNGDLYCMARTTAGAPVHYTSKDRGRTWTAPEFATYTPGGRRIKHPRANPRLWKCRNGKYLFWFHHHGGKTYADRNPAWLLGGVEKDGRIHWSQPEIVLYDDDPKVRMSYPDLIEQDNRYWITETQKSIARIHEIDRTLLEDLWSQGQLKQVTRQGLLLEYAPPAQTEIPPIPLPKLNLPSLRSGGGFTLDFQLILNKITPGQIILDTRDDRGQGLAVTTSADGALQIDLSDGANKATWAGDPDALQPGRLHHLTFVIDAGPKIITFVSDGIVSDGGPRRQYGWGRFPHALANVSGGPLRLAPNLDGELPLLRVYDRPLRHAEAIANHLAEKE